jgi:hypothetical protein
MTDRKRKMTDEDWAKLVQTLAENTGSARKETVTLQSVKDGRVVKGMDVPRNDMSAAEWAKFKADAAKNDMLWSDNSEAPRNPALLRAELEAGEAEVRDPSLAPAKERSPVTVRLQVTPEGEAREAARGAVEGATPAPKGAQRRPGSVGGQIADFVGDQVVRANPEDLPSRRGGDRGAVQSIDTELNDINARRASMGQAPWTEADRAKAAATPMEEISLPNAYDAAKAAGSAVLGGLDQMRRTDERGLEAFGDFLGGAAQTSDVPFPAPAPRPQVPYAGPMARSPDPSAGAPTPSGGAGLSASASVRGSGGGGMSFPPVRDMTREIAAASENEQSAIREQGRIEGTMRDEQARLADREMARIGERERSAAAFQESQAQKSQEFMNKIAEDYKILNNPAKTPDPERYWQGHSKIMFAIGVGLLAQAGKDINGVLSNVNQAIDRDVEQQKQEFEAPAKAARGRIAAAQSGYAMFRQQGYDAFESQKLMEAFGRDRYAQEGLKLAAANGSETARAKAAQMSAQSQMDGASKMQQVLEHRQRLELDRAKAAEDRRQFSVTQGAKASVGRKLTEAERKAMQHNRDAVVAIRKIRETLGPTQKFISAAGDTIAKNVPLYSTQAKQKSTAVEALKTVLATDLAKSSLQAHEQKRWLGEGGLLGGVGLDNQSQLGLDELEDLLLRSYDATELGEIPGARAKPQAGPFDPDTYLRGK